MREEELPEGALFDPFRGVTYAQGSLYELAEWYDVDYAAYLAEEPFYRMLAEQHVGPGQAYVELGAGTGRLCIRMAQRGVRVHAVEPAEGMRRRLERRAQNLDEDAGRLTVEARSAHDFEGPDDAEPALIAFPFNGVLHVFGAEALRAVLGRCRDKLAPEGRVALDITSPSWEAMARRGLSWGRVDDRVHPQTGARIVTCDKSEYDDATRVLRTTYLFVEEGGRAARVLLEQYMWTYQEILYALEESGFTVDLVFGNVDFAPFEEKSPRLLVSARRRKGPARGTVGRARERERDLDRERDRDRDRGLGPVSGFGVGAGGGVGIWVAAMGGVLGWNLPLKVGDSQFDRRVITHQIGL